MRSPDSENLEGLFHAAAELPTADRAEFLIRADPRLAPVVLEMLKGAHDPVWSQSALEIEARQTAFDSRPAQHGQMFGPYRIVRCIAAGGMSFVYEAVRDDAEFHKRVAIKFVQPGIENPAGIERFRTERQILAELEHPNIARLLDGGTAPDGVPYLVMEYVEGEPIDRYAERCRLAKRERLTLFLQVCAALQYAHRKLINHRDLKPANILVTAEGAPKLLDFGIAKLLSGESSGCTVAALTPEYASPEQVKGGSVGTASDIYSLGVLLFSLLTGRSPYRAVTAPSDLVHAICDEDPVWQPRGMIDRDLQSILALALRKESERRYTSVEQLAEDIRRYLEGRPVAARSGAALYRIAKFMRRRAILLAAATAVLIAGIAGVVSTVRQSHRVERRFNDVRGLAHSVLFDVFDSIKPLPGSLGARRTIAANAQKYLDRLSREAADDPALLRDLAESYLRLGDVLGGPYGPNLGETAAALANYQKARGLLELEAAHHPNDSALQSELTQTYLSMGRVLTRQHRNEEAIGILNRSIPILAALSEKSPPNPDRVEMMARAYQYLAESEADLGERQASAAQIEHALILAEKAVSLQESAGTRPGEEWQLRLSSKYFSVGYRLMALAKLTGDITYARRAQQVQAKGHAINRTLAALHPGVPSRPLADGLLSVAQSRWVCCGEFHTAISEIHEALDHFERLARTDPQNEEARRDLANAYGVLASALSGAHQESEALEATRRALAIREELERADPTDGENKSLLNQIRTRAGGRQ